MNFTLTRFPPRIPAAISQLQVGIKRESLDFGSGLAVQGELPMRELRLRALAERSRYVENVLGHHLVGEICSVLWARDPFAVLQIFHSEVDESGFDLALGLNSRMRFIQLKQAHDGKVPRHCSVRLSFSSVPGSCVVLMSHALHDLRLTEFRFFGGTTTEPMANIDAMTPSKSPGRRNIAGKVKIRENYRDVPVSNFRGPFSAAELLDALFPGERGIL